MGDNSSAEERIKAALAAHPEEAVFHELNARVLRAKDQPVAPVREAYERSIELDPENVAALTGLAEIAAEAGDRSEAVALYDRATEADPDDAEAPYAAIQLLLVPEPTSETETEEVVRRLEEMLRKHPRNGSAANDLAKIFIARKDLDRAMALARRADRFILAIEASETIGWIHLLRKEPEPAVKALTRAVERRPHAATPRYRLGLAHLADGDEESARKAFREVIDAEADPESDQALAQLARLDAGDAPE